MYEKDLSEKRLDLFGRYIVRKKSRPYEIFKHPPSTFADVNFIQNTDESFIILLGYCKVSRRECNTKR